MATDLASSLHQALGSRYEFERELGRGGMASVFLARDLKHGRRVAVKVLRPELGATIGPGRFLREIQVAARLTHPHILPLHDSGEANGLLYYVMPYIEGESLRDRLSRDGRLKVEEALEIGRQVADALDYAHTHGVIHRDIKPENILLGAGHAIVADFGIARAVDAWEEKALAPGLTETGGAVGTPMYMSPEQAGGEPDLDGRSDIFSLGCVLFEALTGRSPFAGSTFQAILVRRLIDAAPKLREVDPSMPVAVEATVARALSRHPADRFLTAADFSSALSAAASGISVPTPPAGSVLSSGSPIVEASVAVLPFHNLSLDRENEYFSEGMTEEIINALTQVKGLRVAARTSSSMFRDKDVDVREIGERLNVRTLLEGSVRTAGDRLRVTAQLINAADGYHIWSQTYERRLADVFAVQDELARAIAQALRRTVVGPTGPPLVEPSTDNVPAYTQYLQGRYAWSKASREGFNAALGHFERATVLDPGYALAYAWLSYAYAMHGFEEFALMPPPQALPQAKAAAVKAVDLDPTLADAHFARAVVATIYDWNWELAQREFEQAVTPESSPSLAHHWYAIFLCIMGRMEQALQVIHRAHMLDPLSLTVQVTVGRCLYYARKFEQAVELLQTHLELSPTSIQGCVALARVYLAQEKFQQAVDELERGVAAIGRVPLLLAYAGSAYGALGKYQQALELLAELRAAAERSYVPPVYQALILMDVGQSDEAFRIWNVACEQRSGWLPFLLIDPGWDRVRSDQRFVELLHTMRALTPALPQPAHPALSTNSTVPRDN